MHQQVLRNRTLTRLGLILSVTLLVGFMAPRHAEATTSSEKYMASLINRARHHYGRSSVSLNESLSNYARKHSATMAAQNRLFHNPYLRTWLRNWSYRVLGENVGYGSTVRSVYDAFMRSAPHKANILDRRYRNIGVGIVSKNGRQWVTIIFRG
jgi:uncharacterized protein YkwD